MSENTFTTMVRDGKNLIEIIQKVPEEKRPLLSALAGAFIDGMLAQDRLATEQERPGA